MSGQLVRWVCAVALVAVAASVTPVPPVRAQLSALAAPAPGGPAGQPGDQPVGALLTRLRTLYRQIEAATKEYEAAAPALRRQRAVAARTAEELAAARSALADSRDEAGRLAREQYRSALGGFSPAVTFLLTADPRPALRHRHELDRAAARRAETLTRLAAATTHTDLLARRARAALDAQLTLAVRRDRRREAVRRGLSEVERLLAGLTDAQLAALAAPAGGRAPVPPLHRSPGASPQTPVKAAPPLVLKRRTG
ncbi:hypothetical protein [Streptomyces sp. I05A-00742]|uniref:hypothetical protein n=1 Tax=Streptomyces sp. I05A-00742 TaxID=2732853 RepID=UPI001489A072|nr:hypothetical protein [Streptomyces sp. I05A-00742]